MGKIWCWYVFGGCLATAAMAWGNEQVQWQDTVRKAGRSGVEGGWCKLPLCQLHCVWSIFLGCHRVSRLGPNMSQCFPSKLAGLVPHAAGLVRFTTRELLRSFAKLCEIWSSTKIAGKNLPSGESSMNHELHRLWRNLVSQIWMNYLWNILKRYGLWFCKALLGSCLL